MVGTTTTILVNHNHHYFGELIKNVDEYEKKSILHDT